MDDIDELLGRLAHAPVPDAFDGLEARVLDRLSAPSTPRMGLGVGAVAILGALAMGMAGAGLPGASAAARAPLSPFGPSLPLAPSTLLAGVP